MSKRTFIILSFILLTSTLLGSSVLTRGHFWGDDFAGYIMQAKSILAGSMDEFVVANTFTVTQSSEQIGPAAYPWGFPLMLAPVYALIGLSPLALKLPGLMAYLAFLFVFFFLIKRRFTLTESLLSVSLFAFNPELLRFLDNILSDVPFLFLSTLTLLLTDLYVHETRPKSRLTLAALTGVTIFAAYFVRTQGLILFASVLLFQGILFLRHGEERRAIMVETVLAVTTFGVLWGISSLIFPGGQSSYLALYSGFSTELFINNIIYYAENFRRFFMTLPGEALIFWIFILLCLIGLVARFSEDLLFVLFIVLYFVVLWSWPERQGYRFIFPLLPLFVYFVFHGIRTLLGWIRTDAKGIGQKIAYVFLFLIVVSFTINAGNNAYVNLRSSRNINGPFDPLSLETYDFIRNETAPESVIVFFKPRAMHLMTDRNSLALTECDRIPEGDYLALSKKVGENLQIPPEQIDECNLLLEKVFENRRFIVYKISE